MTILNNCPVCKGTRFQPFISCKDYTVSGERFTIVNCESCNFRFTNPRPEDSVIGNYYKSENYISHTNTRKGLISQLYHLVRSYTLGKKESLLRQFVSRGTLLDYGCGTGMFLAHCKSKQWNVLGVEPDVGARTIAAGNGVDVYENVDSLPVNGALVDAITLWHVLEHVSDLPGTLTALKLKLKNDGVLILALPNYMSHDAKYYGEYWAAYDVPRHLYHFNLDSVKRLMEGQGFNLVSSHPMKFDSFYVSMLSERYKHGQSRLVSAFWRGLVSNLRAKSAFDYSSVIYVFKQRV